MTRNWIATVVIAGGLSSATFGQQYPPSQGDPNYNGQYGNGQYDNGQYPADASYNGDPAYNQGYDAPPPPPMPNYGYQRPPMPGPDYYWVDGYWSWVGGRYTFVRGYWMLPPYAGGYWIAPRYYSGRYFGGFWGGGRRDFDRGYTRRDYGYQARVEVPRQSYRVEASRQTYRTPVQSAPAYRGGENRGARAQSYGHNGRR